MSTARTWSHLVEHRRGRNRDVLGDLTESTTGLGDALDEATLHAAQRLDPGAGNTPWLDVHVSGETIGHGALSARILDDLLGPLQGEVDSAIPNVDKEATRLDLVGMSAGSAILQFRPSIASQGGDQAEQLPAVVSVVDAAVRKVLDLHDAIERNSPADSIASITERRPGLADKMHALVKVLEANDVELLLRWRSPSSSRRVSRVSTQGRRYAAGLFETVQEENERIVSGYVYEQSLKGLLRLRANIQKQRSQTIDISIPRTDLARANLALGSYVRVRVREQRLVDRLGREKEASRTFLEIVDQPII